MSLTIKRYPDLAGPLWFYGNAEKLWFSKQHWLYLREKENGDLDPLPGIIVTETEVFQYHLRRFLRLSLEIHRHTRGGFFEERMKTFPSDKFHEWADAGNQLRKYAA